MASSTQENIKDLSRFKRAFLPTRIEAASLLIGSFLFLLIINTFSFFRTIGGENYTLASELIRSYIERLLAPTDNQQGSQILTVVFWMFIGIMAYLIVWIIVSVIQAYNSDVHGSKRLVLPQGSSSKRIFHEYVLRLAIRILATIMFLYWIYLLLAGFLPYASQTFLKSMTDISLKNLLWTGWSVLVLAGSVFVAVIFARCIVLRERVFGS